VKQNRKEKKQLEYFARNKQGFVSTGENQNKRKQKREEVKKGRKKGRESLKKNRKTFEDKSKNNQNH